MSQNMSIPELIKMFNGIPRRGEMMPVLAYTKPLMQEMEKLFPDVIGQ